MNHAFALRLPLGETAACAAVSQERLSRMTDQGWTTVDQGPGTDLGASYCGAAAFSPTPEWLAIGLAFLSDRPAVQMSLGLSADEISRKSDLDLILDLHKACGRDFAQDLMGSFSVVVLERRTGEVAAYRDPLGVYPLYYTVHQGALVCASDLRACVHLSGCDLVADPLRIADFIHGEDIDLDRTAFEGVFRVPPGHRLCSGPQGVAVEQYWQLEAPPCYAGHDSAVLLREALGAATAACAKAQTGVGAMLSGGLDSSSLVALAAQNVPGPLKTLSFVYGADKSYDETPHIDAVTEAFGTVSHKIPITEGVPLDALDPIIQEQMDFFLAPGLPKSRRIYAEARTLGLAALIDGHGGDEAISHGYGRLVELAAGRKYRALAREALGASQVHGVPFLALLAGHLGTYGGLPARHPLRRMLMKTARVLSRRANVSDWSGKAASLIAPDLRASFDDTARYAREVLLNQPSDFRRAEQITHIRALTDPLMVHSFEVLHRSATAAGILPCYPFMDRRVVTLSLSLPADQKLRGGRSRWILRQAMQGILPDSVRLRKDKAEFGNEIRDTVTAYYRDKDGACFEPLAEYVDVAAAERLRADFISGKVTQVAAIRALWRLAVLSQWLPAFAGWRAAQLEGELM